MHARALLHTRLLQAQPSIHQARLNAVVDAVDGLLACQTLQLTAIGRALPGTTQDKHAIKRVDRLLGNHHLAMERRNLYGWMAALLLCQTPTPRILVDYSEVNAERSHFLLRAAIPLGGRAMTLYEEVHERNNHPVSWRRFLQHLASLLPTGCRPIIVTDAGFRGTWRRALDELGWFYVTRQRNRELYRTSPDQPWRPCKSLYQLASRRPKALGTVEICRESPHAVAAYILAEPAKCRKAMTKTGKPCRSASSLKHAEREREPWLLLSNLPKRYHSAKQVVSIYRQRMQIEESFRDLKSARYGLAFRGNQCRNAVRLQALLLLASLALFVIWLLGLHAVRHALHYGMQANTTRHRSVLSLTTIGLRYAHCHKRLTAKEAVLAIQDLQRQLSCSHAQ